MKLGIFSYFAWMIVCLNSFVPDGSDYIDALLVHEAEELLKQYKRRAEFVKRSSITRRQE